MRIADLALLLYLTYLRNAIVGDKISAADISFAALAAPLLRPRNHPIYSSKTDNISQEMVNIVKDLRKTRPGKFALRLYSKSRRY